MSPGPQRHSPHPRLPPSPSPSTGAFCGEFILILFFFWGQNSSIWRCVAGGGGQEERRREATRCLPDLRVPARQPPALTSHLPVKSELRHRNTPCQISESEDVRETTAANLYINWF